MKLNKINELWNSANSLSGVFVLLSPRNLATMATWRNDFSKVASFPSLTFPASPQSWPQSAPESFNLGKNRWKICTPPPPAPSPPHKSRVRKWRVLAFARPHPWFRGDGGLLFHFILSKTAQMDHLILLCSWTPRRHIGKREDPGDEVVWFGGGLVAVGGGKFWPPYLNSVLSRQGS